MVIPLWAGFLSFLLGTAAFRLAKKKYKYPLFKRTPRSVVRIWIICKWVIIALLALGALALAMLAVILLPHP